MSYLTFNIIFIAVILVILFTVIITRDTDRGRGNSNRRLIAGGKRRNRKRENSREDTLSERYLADCKTMEFFDDSKSSDPEKKRVGSHFWIESRRLSDGVQLSLYKDNWGAEADYMMSEDGFVESIKTVKGFDMQRLMVLCDFAKNGGEVVEYIYKRFSPDGYNAYLNILHWFDENGIETSSWTNW